MLTTSLTHFSWHKKQRSVAPRQLGDAKKTLRICTTCEGMAALPRLEPVTALDE
jgi:hypothetical protein